MSSRANLLSTGECSFYRTPSREKEPPTVAAQKSKLFSHHGQSGHVPAVRGRRGKRERGGGLHLLHRKSRRDVLQRQRRDQLLVERIVGPHIGHDDAEHVIDV